MVLVCVHLEVYKATNKSTFIENIFKRGGREPRDTRVGFALGGRDG